MKKIVLLLLLCVINSFSSKISAIYETAEGYHLKIETPTCKILDTLINDQTIDGRKVNRSFSRVIIDGFEKFGRFGGPEQVSYIYELAYEGNIPELSIKSLKIDTINLNFKLFPMQPFVPYSHKGKLPFAYNENYYSKRSQTPKVASIKKTFKIRGQKGVQILIKPVVYNQIKNEIYVHRDISIKIKTNKPTSIRSNNSKSFDKIIRATFENIKMKSFPPKRSRIKEKYLIIAADRFSANTDLKSFFDFRSQTHDVILKSMSDIGGSTKSNLHAIIEREKPAFLVFVGEYKDFPSYDGIDVGQLTNNMYTGFIKTYLPYIDGGDGRPDISLGLFFVRSKEALKNIVDKTINNQKNLDKMGNGYLCFAGHNDYTSPWPMSPSHIDEIFDDFEKDYWKPMGFDLTKVYSDKNPNKGDCQKVVSTLNKGLRFLNYNGHGLPVAWNFIQKPQPDCWGEGYFPKAQKTFKLNAFGKINNKVHPFVISCCCLSGQFKNPTDCWAETWIGHKNLATVFIGSSEISFGNQHAMNAYLMEAIKDHDITVIGNMFMFAINSTFGTNKFTNFGASYFAEVGAQEYHLFGDPACETMKPQNGQVPIINKNAQVKNNLSINIRPSSKQYQLTVPNSGEYSLTIRNLAGKVLYHKNHSLNSGEHKFHLPNLSRQLVIFTIKGPLNIKTRKFYMP